MMVQAKHTISNDDFAHDYISSGNCRLTVKLSNKVRFW